MQENRFSPKKRWTRIFRKRWFYPSIFLILAALLISVFFWYQNDADDQELTEERFEEGTGDYTPIPSDGDAEPVMEQQEVVKLPVANSEEAQIVTKFFDYDADDAEKVNALIHYNNRYYQSTGIDIATADGESFEVVAALSGTVIEVKEDPLLGNVVVIDHGDEVKTYYASLGDVTVEQGAKVEQGDLIGEAGKNNFGKENGTHVHFEIRKGDTALNPELLLNQPLASIDQIIAASEATEEEAEEAEESNESAEEDSTEDEEGDDAGEEETEDESQE